MAASSAILNGPSKEGLADALFDGTRVKFHLAQLGAMDASVQYVLLEDGSLQSWCIGGYIIPKKADGSDDRWQHFTGYYRSDKRKGHLTVEARS